VIDVKQQINSVRRQIGSRVLEAGEARTATISQTYDATVEDVWDACTNPERLPRWFAPVTGELQLGGRYQVEGNASGVVERCDPPKSFATTWEFGGQVSWIEVRLAPEGDGRTRFELEHIAHVSDEIWAEYGPGATGIGWDLALMGLARHLAGAPPVDPQESMEWSLSDEGKEFATLSGQKWRDADVAFGTDEDGARAAADRSIAFYTTAPS
jgi:uncharacterized protein YndB with AHSA1/START domain